MMTCAAIDLLHCANPNPAPEAILVAMRRSAGLLGVRPLAELSVPFVPHGVTTVLVLAESHLTVSTWPEHHMTQIDLVTCRADTDPEHAIEPLVRLFDARDVRIQLIQRTDPRTGPHQDLDAGLGPLDDAVPITGRRAPRAEPGTRVGS